MEIGRPADKPSSTLGFSTRHMVCKRRCSLKFPTLTTSAGATFAPAGRPAAAAFAEHVAKKHFQDIAELEHGLEEALFHGVCAERPPRDRRRIVSALRMIASHLSKQGISPFLVTELNRFNAALEDLDRGTVHYSLAHIPARNRPVLGSDIWEVRAYASIAFDILLSGGDNKAEAAKKVCMGLGPSATVIAPNSSNIPKLLIEWHRELNENRCNDGSAQQTFDSRDRFLLSMSKGSGGIVGEQLALAVIEFATLLAIRAAPPDVIKKILESGAGKIRRK